MKLCQFRKVKPERPSKVCPDVLRIENRIQMFCYYNTLAWAILAATLASDIVLATLPFVVACDIRSIVLPPIIVVCLFLPVGGGLAVYRLRNLAARWVSYSLEDSWEDDSMSPRAWIDYVEAGNWEMRRPARACGTYAVVIGLLAVVEWISAWLWLSVSAWLWPSVGAVSLPIFIGVSVAIVLPALFLLCRVCDDP
jgi:hypothetical protein